MSIANFHPPQVSPPADPPILIAAGVQIDDAPAVRYLQALLETAVAYNASDLHLEPQPEALHVRFRIDGRLQHASTAPTDLGRRLAARIKVLARLDIAERRLPQDGHFRHWLDGRAVDFRVATLPTLHGEKLLLRVLDAKRQLRTLSQLGMEADQLARLTLALAAPSGIILVTGPTGSGKTVTLYACLQALNDGSRNLCTAEDPVEIELPDVTQVQINEAIGLGFAPVLRALLRQDPDVLMIGEIRDPHSAQTAVRATRTGHLVLSTLHTDDAPSAVSRLENLGIARAEIADCLRLVIAQRLVRRRCAVCGGEYPECSACAGEGFAGRTGIHELLPLDPPLRALIGTGASTARIAAHARAAGLPSLYDAGRRLIDAGITTAGELERILGPAPGDAQHD